MTLIKQDKFVHLGYFIHLGILGIRRFPISGIRFLKQPKMHSLYTILAKEVLDVSIVFRARRSTYTCFQGFGAKPMLFSLVA